MQNFRALGALSPNPQPWRPRPQTPIGLPRLRFQTPHSEFLPARVFSESLGSAGKPEVTSFLPLSEPPKEFHTVLSTMHGYQCVYSINCTAYLLSMQARRHGGHSRAVPPK